MYRLLNGFLLIFCFSFVLNFNCTQKKTNINNDTLSTNIISELKHTQSEYNDKNKKKRSNNPVYEKKDLLGAWTVNPDGPHADFEFTKDYFFSVDQEGDGKNKYTIKNDSIYIHFDEFVSKGSIKKATKDSLIIIWEYQGPKLYLRWKG